MDAQAFSQHVEFPKHLKTADLETISLDRVEKKDANEAVRLFNACQHYGFFYLNLRESTAGRQVLDCVSKLFPLSEQVFDLPAEQKQPYDLKDKGIFMGYKAVGETVIDRSGALDRMEAWNIGKDDIMQTGTENPNPPLITDHRALLQQYTTLCHQICVDLFHSLEQSLHLPADAMATLHKLDAASGDHVRFLKCPSQPPHDRQTAVGEHTDFGSITVLFNRLAGLRVVEPGVDNAWNEWPWAPPRPDHAIINLGDAMVKLTNGLFRSNVHRVDPPPVEQSTQARYSLVYFSRPNDEVKLKRLEGSDVIPELPEGVTEEDINSKDWVTRRAMGKRVGNFQGAEHWDKIQGTEKAMKTVKVEDGKVKVVPTHVPVK